MQGFDFIVLETANVDQVTVITSVVRVGGLSKGGDHIRKPEQNYKDQRYWTKVSTSTNV